jgi:hypothetical protein
MMVLSRGQRPIGEELNARDPSLQSGHGCVTVPDLVLDGFNDNADPMLFAEV